VYFGKVKRIHTHAPFIISLLLLLAFCLKNLREPDLWWQLRTGEWILQNKAVPVTDPFSFTHAGEPWLNIKWGFEVCIAWITQMSGPENILLLQVILGILLWICLKKWCRHHESYSPIIFLLVSIPVLLIIQFRLSGRPEMMSFLLSVVFVYLFERHLKTKDHHIWWLIPLQIIWCNFHEAFGMGLVIGMIYLFAHFIQNKKWSWSYTAIFLALIGATLVNPRAHLLPLRALNIFNQLQVNKFTTELVSILSPLYWGFESILFILFISLTGYLIIRQFKLKETSPFSLAYFGVLAATTILSLMAFRNIVFPVLLAFPFLMYTLKSLQVKLKPYWWMGITLGVIFYGMIVSNKYYQLIGSRDLYGLEVRSVNNPVGAAQYLKNNGAGDERIFSDYLTSSYLLWRLQPGFKTYIDLRDLDVFSTAFFENYFQVANDPKQFHMLDQKMNFKHVVLYRQSHQALHRYLYTDSIYACVYADPVAMVYSKTDSFSRNDIFSRPPEFEQSSLALLISKIFNPFYSPFDYSELDIDWMAGQYYFQVGRILLAEARIRTYLNNHPDDQNAQNLIKEIEKIKGLNKPF
jgi:hypothetical protein